MRSSCLLLQHKGIHKPQPTSHSSHTWKHPITCFSSPDASFSNSKYPCHQLLTTIWTNRTGKAHSLFRLTLLIITIHIKYCLIQSSYWKFLHFAYSQVTMTAQFSTCTLQCKKKITSTTPVMAKLNFQQPLLKYSITYITRSFRHHSNMLIWCSINIYYYYKLWKWLCCFIFLWKLWWTERSEEQHLF